MDGSGAVVTARRWAAPAAPWLTQDVFAAVYAAHSACVYGLAARVLHDREQAEDVTQEVFVRLWQRPERYEPARGSLRSFLLSDCHGRAVDRLRSDRARSSRER